MLEYSYPRYLRAKRTVDDRALNAHVRQAAFAGLGGRSGLRVAELGGGIGTMIDRLIEAEAFVSADYTLVDAEAQFLAEASEMVPQWMCGRTRGGDGSGSGSRAHVEVVHASIEAWLAADANDYDVIIAHAVLDLVDARAILPRLLTRLAPQGVLWTTVNFDGETIFMPPVEGDRRLIDAYHRSMDARTGSSTAGRELFGHVAASGGVVRAAGASDWVVFPSAEGKYPADEAYFLHHIVHTVEQELGTHSELGATARRWGRQRHRQIETGQLVYVAHQLDFAVARA